MFGVMWCLFPVHVILFVLGYVRSCEVCIQEKGTSGAPCETMLELFHPVRGVVVKYPLPLVGLCKAEHLD